MITGQPELSHLGGFFFRSLAQSLGLDGPIILKINAS